MGRGRGLALAVLALALAAAPAAEAGTVSRDGTEYRYADETSGANLARFLYCTPSGGINLCSGSALDSSSYFLISDNGGTPTAATGSGCAPWSSSPTVFLQCPAAGITNWTVTMIGGNDQVNVQDCCGTFPLPLSISGGEGNDSVSLFSASAPATIDGGPGDDSLNGGSGFDSISGGEGTDTLNGNGGDDSLDGGFGGDVLNGGAATDSVTYAGRSEAVTVDAGATGASNGSANDGPAGARDKFQNIEIVRGGSGDDDLNGGSFTGALTLEGRGGADRLRAGVGATTLRGEGGNDQLEGGAAADTLDGGDGADLLDGGFGGDLLNGGPAADTVTYAARSEAVTVDLGVAAASGSGNDGPAGARDTIQNTETVRGGAGGDDLDGSTYAGALTLEGGGGGDRLRGGLGANTILGEGGNDDLEGRAAADMLDGGAGHDRIDGLGGADTVFGGAGFDSIEARDGEADSVDCGPDDDAATTDPIDARASCDTAPAATPPAPSAPAATSPASGGTTTTVTVIVPSRLVFDLGYGFTAARRATKLKELSLDVEPGARVTASCRTATGKRCTRTRDLARATASGSVRLRGFENKALPVGAKLQMRGMKDGMIGVVKTLTVRKRKAPSVKTQCLPPGSAKPAAC